MIERLTQITQIDKEIDTQIDTQNNMNTCKNTVNDVTDKWLIIGNMILAFRHRH